MPKQHTRQLKIYGLHRRRRYGRNKEVPQLRLSGVWMEQLGFKVGDRVSITTRDRLLIIEPLQVAEAEPDYQAALKQVKQTLKQLAQ